jgi:hypothetical protein
MKLLYLFKGVEQLYRVVWNRIAIPSDPMLL